MERYNLADILRAELLGMTPEDDRSPEVVEEALQDPNGREMLEFCGKSMLDSLTTTIDFLIKNPGEHAVSLRALSELKKAIRQLIYFELPPVEED